MGLTVFRLPFIDGLLRRREFYLHAVFTAQNQRLPIYFIARHALHGGGERIFQLIVFAQHGGGGDGARFQAARAVGMRLEVHVVAAHIGISRRQLAPIHFGVGGNLALKAAQFGEMPRLADGRSRSRLGSGRGLGWRGGFGLRGAVARGKQQGCAE